MKKKRKNYVWVVEAMGAEEHIGEKIWRSTTWCDYTKKGAMSLCNLFYRKGFRGEFRPAKYIKE